MILYTYTLWNVTTFQYAVLILYSTFISDYKVGRPGEGYTGLPFAPSCEPAIISKLIVK